MESLFTHYFLLLLGIRIQNCQFIWLIFSIQGHRDPEKDQIVKNSAKVCRSSLCLILELFKLFGYPIWSCDVFQAFVESEDNTC